MAPRTKPQPSPAEGGTANALIEEALKLEAWKKQQNELMRDHLKPCNTRLEEIDNQLLAILNAQGADNIKCDAGTAYKSNLLQIGIDPESIYQDQTGEHNAPGNYTGAEACLYYTLDNPPADMPIGDALIIKPAMDYVKWHMEKHGRPPPGVKTSYFTRINIRKS